MSCLVLPTVFAQLQYSFHSDVISSLFFASWRFPCALHTIEHRGGCVQFIHVIHTVVSHKGVPMIDLIVAQNELWDLYTARGEYRPWFTDDLGRIPCYASHNRSPFDPVISRFLKENGLAAEYPDGKRFCVCLTHDLGTSRHYSGKRGRGGFRRVTDAILGSSGHAREFDAITFVEERFGVRSTFFVPALDPVENNRGPRLSDIEGKIRDISDRGWEVGLLGSATATTNADVLRTEKSRLESVLGSEIAGFRSHHLRFTTPDTWDVVADAGFEYDTSFAFPDCCGFRNGLCHPFRPYNLEQDAFFDLLEIPPIVAYGTLVSSMRLSVARSWEIVTRLVEAVAECSGVLCLLWHNGEFAEESEQMYLRLLEYCRKRDAWITSIGDICSWWKKQPAWLELCEA